MDLANQYIAQIISVSSNNLRLSPEKVEIVGLLRELFLHTESVAEEIRLMKKVTELSRFAIKLSEIYNFLSADKVDFLGISEKFREQSDFITKDFEMLIEGVSLGDFKNALHKLDEMRTPPAPPPPPAVQPNIPVTAEISEIRPESPKEQLAENEKAKVKIILDEETSEDGMLFQNYENAVMRPIKTLDALFKRIPGGDVTPDEFIQFARIMKINADLSEKFGTEIIANMHRIVAKTLILLKNRDLMPGKDVIESIRSCLIVIVALVKSKEVDISVYLNKAEEFGRLIKQYRIKEH